MLKAALHGRMAQAVMSSPWLVLLVLAIVVLLAIRSYSRRAPADAEMPDDVDAARAEMEIAADAESAESAVSAQGAVTAAEAQRLCAFIQETTQLDPHGKPGQQLAMLVRSIFRMEAAAVFDADLHEVYRTGEFFDNLEDVLQNIYFFETASDDHELGLVRRVLRMGKLPIGAMLLRGETSASTADAIASVIAITFDRYHALANESRTETARQTEQMRATVLDSLAHAYKTPLTAIEAASSGLAAMGSLTPAQAGLVTLIEEQADQLSQLTTRLLKTARLDSSDLVPKIATVGVAPLIEDVVASLQAQLTNYVVEVAISRDNLSLCCDRGLVVALLTQYLDNASKYADAGSTITIQAVEEGDKIIFSVRSVGPLIAESEYERIFDRYYRSPTAESRASGTGIGLSVARRAAQAHDGDTWVTSDAAGGTTFYASLPVRYESLPVECESLPVQCESLPLRQQGGRNA